jgi:hypothetical protein
MGTEGRWMNLGGWAEDLTGATNLNLRILDHHRTRFK